jgi:hypothetical protein
LSDIGISNDIIVWAVLIICIVVLLVSVGILSFLLLRARAEKYNRGLFGSWPIRRILPDQLDPSFPQRRAWSVNRQRDCVSWPGARFVFRAVHPMPKLGSWRFWPSKPAALLNLAPAREKPPIFGHAIVPIMAGYLP